MSKPIKLNDEMISAITQEFIEAAKKTKMSDGRINYSRDIKWEGTKKACVMFSPAAFAKMAALVQAFDTEVAWHGVVLRDEKEPNRFHITDIMVYPQIVTGGTANTEQLPYQNWLYAHSDEVFNNMRMQGHSHVNYSVTPSAVDITHQEKILSQIGDDMFYIFMIWNKKFEKTIRIFDMANNTLYETDDVEICIGEENLDLNTFVAEAKKLVEVRNPQQYGSHVYGDSPYDWRPAGYRALYNIEDYQRQTRQGGKQKAGKKGRKPDGGRTAKGYGDHGYPK